MITYTTKKIRRDLEVGEIEKPIRAYDDFSSVFKTTRKHLTDNELLKQILRTADVELSLKAVGKGFASRVLTVGTSPVEIIPVSKFPRGYIIINPAPIVGITTTGTLYSGTFAVTTNTNALGVANYKDLHLFMNITDSTGTALQINAQAQDPVSLNWTTTQSDIFSSNEAVGTYFAFLGPLGVATQFRLNMVPTGSYTLSIGYALKEGLGGGSGATLRTVYIGNRDVNTTSGYDLFEGQREYWYLLENTSLWAVALASTTIKIFELQ